MNQRTVLQSTKEHGCCFLRQPKTVGILRPFRPYSLTGCGSSGGRWKVPEFLLNTVVPLAVRQTPGVTLTRTPGDQVSADRADSKLLVVEFPHSST